uniref:Uncharacterized protein n=1 Tax=uncultured bacterium pAW1 TaxID=1781155 RepID=A0A1C9U4Q2_9BACT|nr:hypothetical protein [uncultured bacterium pAW1]
MAALFVLAAIPSFAEENAPMHFFARLIPPRQDFPETMTATEQKIMGEHFAYLKQLTQEKRVIMAGPCLEPVFGAVILASGSLEEARTIMSNDPSVAQGVNTFEIQPMILSLLAHNVPAHRYPKEQSGKVIQKSITVPVSAHDAWTAWTSAEGIKSFLPIQVSIDLKVGGKYEWLFSEDAPEGQRGSEDCLILSYIPDKMLSFEWNAPPQYADQRRQRTIVVILFEEREPGQTTIDFTHHGFGVGEEWDKVHAYFENAWGSVLTRYAESVTKK